MSSSYSKYRSLFRELNCCVIVPTYNNRESISTVLEGIKSYCDDIIVVIDGATDGTADIVELTEGVDTVAYIKNRGKGYALRRGFKYAIERGYSHAITIDSDGQHYPSDIPKFLQHLQSNKSSITIGSRELDQDNVPRKSNFGNRFSNFWFKLETGIEMPDTQSGYRLYPIKALSEITLYSSKFEFEIEVLVRASWRGITIDHIPIGVYYPKPEDRVTHFRPFKDFFRISILNTVLVTLAFLYHIPRRIYLRFKKRGFKRVIKEDIIGVDMAPIDIAKAVGFGVFMGIVPIWGYQLIIGTSIAHLLKINKTIFVVAANISIPPMIPIILYLSYLSGSIALYGDYSPDIVGEITFEFIKSNFVQYIVGAFIFATLAGLLSAVVTYVIALLYKKERN